MFLQGNSGISPSILTQPQHLHINWDQLGRRSRTKDQDIPLKQKRILHRVNERSAGKTIQRRNHLQLQTIHQQEAGEHKHLSIGSRNINQPSPDLRQTGLRNKKQRNKHTNKLLGNNIRTFDFT